MLVNLNVLEAKYKKNPFVLKKKSVQKQKQKLQKEIKIRINNSFEKN